MSSSETSFSTADSEDSLSPTVVTSADHSTIHVTRACDHVQRDVDHDVERACGRWARLPSFMRTFNEAEPQRPKVPKEGSKKVQLYNASDGSLKVPDEGDEHDIIYNVENGLLSIDEARRIQSVQIAKELDLRPGVKLLSYIPWNRWGFIHWQQEYGSFLPLKLDLSCLDVQELSLLRCFPHLKILNLANNKLRVDNMTFLQYLPNLAVLDLASNRLFTCDLPCLTLKWLSLKDNRIVWMDPFTYPELQSLNVDDSVFSKYKRWDFPWKWLIQ